jgi:hypothetical protein
VELEEECEVAFLEEKATHMPWFPSTPIREMLKALVFLPDNRRASASAEVLPVIRRSGRGSGESRPEVLAMGSAEGELTLVYPTM